MMFGKMKKENKMSEEWKKDRIGSAIRGENPMVIATLKSGFAVIGDTQFLPGYCVLLPNRNVNSLNNLSLNERRDFLIDMSLIGDAILTVCNPRRINYEILGNTDVFLHAHIFPRYEWEEEERKKDQFGIIRKTIGLMRINSSLI